MDKNYTQRVKMAAIKDNTYEIDTVLRMALNWYEQKNMYHDYGKFKVQNIVQLLFSEKNSISLHCTAKYLNLITYTLYILCIMGSFVYVYVIVNNVPWYVI